MNMGQLISYKTLIDNFLIPIFLNNYGTKAGNFSRYKNNDVNFKNIYLTSKDGVEIGVWILEPKSINSNTKYLIALHGTGQNRKSFINSFKIDKLVNLNIVLLVPDYRAFGDSEGEYDVGNVNYDVDAVYDYCKKAYGKRPEFLGYSLGGAVALEYSRYRPHNQKIILVSTFTSTIDILREDKKWKLAESVFPNAEKEIEKHFNYDSINAIGLCNSKNVLILHGDADKTVPYEHGVLLATKINCNLVTFSNCDHFSIFDGEKLFDEINKFLNE